MDYTYLRMYHRQLPVGFDVSGVSGNYVGTIQNAGGDDNVDSDADSNTGLTGVFNFDPTNGDDLSVDAGFISPCDILPLSATIPCDIDGFSDYCIPVAYADIFNYDIYIDAEQYFNLPFICDLDTIGGYDFTTAINQGAYGGSIHRLLQWTVNGTLYNLNRLYTDFSELEFVMDSLDALGNWTTIGDRIEGGLISSNYGPIRIFHPELGAISITEYNQNIFSRGSLIEVPQGCHWVTLVNTQTGCTDSVYVCTDCLPTPDTIRVTIPTDSLDTICVTLEEGFGGGDITYSLCNGDLSGTGNFGSYIVTADGCLIYESDSISGIDTVCVIACDASLGLCDTTIIIIEVVPPVDTIRDTICTTCTDTICLDNDFEPGVITTTTLCDGSTRRVAR
ncbi:MAG: hypothetical protein IPH74_00825 [Bacteroidetes bacterium]|nr:hypothetical protein [Bacteroidota bacterium]